MSLIHNREEEFPALKKYKVYLNTAGTGLYPRRAYEAIREFTEKTIKNEWKNLREEVEKPTKEEISKLINCKPHEISFSVQTTDGLKRLLLSLNLKKGMNIVGADLEFPSISFGAESLCRKIGCETRIVNHRDGVYNLEDFEEEIDENTRAVAISSVQWINGAMVDLKELCKIAHEKGALVIIDGIQHVGAITLDVKKTGIDAMAVGGEKWLINSNIGSGFIYVSDEAVKELEPPIYGLANFKPPEAGWGEWWPLRDKDVWHLMEPAEDASKYEWGGGKPYVLLESLRSCIKLINQIGIEEIEKHNRRLKEKLVDTALGSGYRILGYVENQNLWSSITNISLGMKYTKELELVRRLSEQGIQVSYRGAAGISGIRISPHFYNTKEDVEKFFEELERIKKKES